MIWIWISIISPESESRSGGVKIEKKRDILRKKIQDVVIQAHIW